MTSRVEGTQKSWKDPKIREKRSERISEAQLARSEDISRITSELWERPEYRAHVLETKRLRKQAYWDALPEKLCEVCSISFKVLPCRASSKKYCSKECRVKARTGTPNLKNRGKIPSRRAGSGISGSFEGNLFRSLYELSFIIAKKQEGVSVEYETIKIELSDGTHYIPDFISHELKMVWEVKHSKALTQPRIQYKIESGQKWANENGFSFQLVTEKTMRMLTFEEIIPLVKEGKVVLHKKKNGGVRYKQLLKKLEQT